MRAKDLSSGKLISDTGWTWGNAGNIQVGKDCLSFTLYNSAAGYDAYEFIIDSNHRGIMSKYIPDSGRIIMQYLYKKISDAP